jgi:hypothetical protein
MIKNWHRLDIEVEMRNDWERPAIPKNLKEHWIQGIALKDVFTEQWLREYYPILGVDVLVLFYYAEGQVAPKSHIDWRRRWVLNFTLQPDQRTLTWYPEVPVTFDDPEDPNNVRSLMKRFSPLYKIEPNSLVDSLCFDSNIRKLHLLRTDVPHHVGQGLERWGFSLYSYNNWDVPYADSVKRLQSRIVE